MKDEDLEIGMKAKAKLMESIMGQFSFARGSEELSEDIQTPEREREMRAAFDGKKGPAKQRSRERLVKRDEQEKQDQLKLYGKGGKVVAKRSKEWIPVKEDIQTPERKEEGKKEKKAAYNAVRKTAEADYKKRREIYSLPGSLDPMGYSTDAARRKAKRTPEARASNDARRNLEKVRKTHEREAEDQENLYGKGGKVVAKRKWIPVKSKTAKKGK